MKNNIKTDNSKNELKPMSLLSLILSFLSLFVTSGILFFNPSPTTYKVLLGIDSIICTLFLIQLTVDFLRSENRKNYFKSHWIDFIASIPLIEPLRYARLFQILRVIRVIRSGRQLIQQISQNRNEATIASILLVMVMLLTLGSGLIVLAEANAPHSNIKDASDALWWAFVTISTVGYGDHYPVTDFGKVIAVVVIISGVGIFGMISGLITSILTAPSHHLEVDGLAHANQNELIQTMINQQKELLIKVEEMEKKLNDLNSD